jgi:pyruvate formate lyase activating enzyme
MPSSADKGLVFNIQRFAIHDGPGIRTTVFLKGCPLHCLWCSNPESIRPAPEIITRDAKCIGCGECAWACPNQAIRISENKRIILREECDSCLQCAKTCPARSIEGIGEYKTVKEVMDVLLKDTSYYQRSGGGVTLSGGEPLVQHQFSASLLAAAKEAGLHTALDTTGCSDWMALAELLRFTDLVLYDIKHLDDRKHREGTGVSNERILANLHKTMAESQAAVWIRIPVIPGFNDSEEAIAKILEFAASLPRMPDKISLLPFHKFGGNKYLALGKTWPCNDAPLITAQQISLFKSLIESHGLSAEIAS